MMRSFISFFAAFLFLSCLGWSQEPAKPYILVTVAPHKFFVEKIAGDTAKVGLMVPAGASAHTYEPTPRQMLAASQASIWFRIGEPFETRAIAALTSHNPKLEIVDMRRGVDLISGDDCHHVGCRCHAHANSADLHYWLSARQAQIQADTIAQALIAKYPENRELYLANLEKFRQELRQLDQDVAEILQPMKNRTIMVSHPAYAYFCRDYNLKQISIEFEGKDPTPQQLTKVLNQARQLNIKSVFIQLQYNNKGARLIADEIGAKVVTLDPYSEHYINSMLEIAHAFAEG